MNEEVLSLILKSFSENNNSHAFLIETNDLNHALQDVLELITQINKSILKTKQINENYSDIKVIRPEGKEIKKDQVKEIINDFQTFPFILRHKYYIIVSSELMNQSSANVLLKFLEEPENEVIGFFLTLNKAAMIDTIVSRCQNYKLLYNYDVIDDYTEAKEFISSMDKSLFKRIIFLNSWFTKDRVKNIGILKNIKINLVNELSKLENIKSLIKRIRLIDDCVNRLVKNANQDLVIIDLARKW